MKPFPLLVLLGLCFALNGQSGGLPEKLRVLTIDLENARIEMPGTPGSELSQDLRRLLETADVDVVCLQGANDWESCERICKLKPGLRVVTCSAFESKNPNVPMPQVAILARDRAVLSWVEEIQDGAGFALAVVQTGSRRLALFSVQGARSGAGSVAATERLLAEVKKLQNFPQNRPDSFLISGVGLGKTTLLTDYSFQNIAPEAGATRSEFWTLNAGFLTRPRTVKAAGVRSPLVVCDFDSANSFSSKFAYQTPLLFAGETPASIQPVQGAAGPLPRQWIWVVVVFLALVCVLLLFRRKPASSMALVPVTGPDGTVVKSHPGDEVARSHLIAWFKSLFVQRLLSQREQMINNEAEATRRTMVIEERLSNLQTALQERIAGYEARIERLEQELTAATFENRDLIRSQIELLKEKVAKAKEEQSVRRN